MEERNDEMAVTEQWPLKWCVVLWAGMALFDCGLWALFVWVISRLVG